MLLRVAEPLVPQVTPNWASSCNARWLNASQGHITVISAREGRRIYKPTSPPGEPFLQTSFSRRHLMPLSYSLSRWQGRYPEWPWSPEDQTNCLNNPLRALMPPAQPPPGIFVGSIPHPLWGGDPRLLTRHCGCASCWCPGISPKHNH